MEAAKLRAYLECPVCLMVPRSRIFSCVNSHQICEPCYRKLVGEAKTCPQGDCGFDNPPRRARSFEAMIENSDFEQACVMVGCNVEVKKDQAKAHELKCIFRPVPCPVTFCQLKFQFKDVFLHIKSNHSDCLRLANLMATQPDISHHILQDSLHVNDCEYSLFMSAKDDSRFYQVFVKKNGFWYCWVTIEGDHEAASSWAFTAEARNDENRIALEFSGVVHPIDLTVEDVIETGHYFLLSRNSVEKLLESQYPRCLRIMFNLTRQKPEAHKAIEQPQIHMKNVVTMDLKMAGPRGETHHAFNSDPNRLVPILINIPAQRGSPASQPMSLTLQVPAHAVQQGGASGITLQRVLTLSCTKVLSFRNEQQAASFLQIQINSAFGLA